MSDIPNRRENWAQAAFQGGAKSIVTLRSGHVLVADEPPGFAGGTGGENAGPTPTGFLAAAFAADIPAILNRIACEKGIEIVSLRARVTFAWNPRIVAGLEPGDPVPHEAITDIWITTRDGSAESMKAAYEKRCPLHNLFKKAGCRMLDHWHVE
ncbi:MAG: OsmC family protein [Betaproteobacteria bacterium]